MNYVYYIFLYCIWVGLHLCHLVRHASAVGQAWLGVVGFNLTLVDLQRFCAWPGCSSGQRADDGCSHQATMPFLLLPASKVAGNSALSVERVPADPCVRVHLQSDWLLQRRPLWSYCGPSGSPTVRPERYGATRPQHSKVLTHLAGHPWWAPLAPSPVSLSVQNLYPRAKQHRRFFATLSTGTLPPCRLRVGLSASSICWPKRPLSSAVSYRELWIARFLNFRTATLEHTASWHSTISWKPEPF